jgi:hypothetical protein
MFQILTDFIDGIIAFEINIPLWIQIAVIIIVIITLSIGGYFMRDFFDISYMRSGMTWFIFIAILNLSTMLLIFLYYNKKTSATSYVGAPGNKGKRGKMGKIGKSVTCSYCKNNIYLQRVRKSDVICTLSTYTTDFKSIENNTKYFDNILKKGNRINYDNFVNGIILGKSIASENTESVNNFRALMTPTSIAFKLVNVINDSITKASRNTYGTFRKPYGKVGYLSIGDSVYGGLEKFELNSFMINGDVMYPSNFTKLVTFTSYNSDTEDTDQYTIWRPNGQSITDNSGFKGAKETFNYLALGDICRFGTEQPKVNQIATIKESCLEVINSSELRLVFFYVGALNFTDERNKLDYTKSNSYLIENKIVNDIEMFSVWRTPSNTFITNCNSQNSVQNNSFIYNMYIQNNNSQNSNALNEYGNISSDAKSSAAFMLQSIGLPKILIASIFCKHYEIELYKELVYYFNRSQNKVPEFTSINSASASFGDLMNIISNTQKQYDDFNKNLIKQSSISLKITKPNGETSDSYTTYDESKEKHLPHELLTIYNSVNNQLLTISVKIENAHNLLDIVNTIFDNGIESRIAKDADGIAEGGSLLNLIQETILMICKMLLPPSQSSYIIKDECLGAFALDRDREIIIKEFGEVIDVYYKLNDLIINDSDKYSAIMQNKRQYEDLMNSQIGQICGHIDNFQTKINDMNLEEFTTTRIKQLIKIYQQMISYLNDIMSKV